MPHVSTSLLQAQPDATGGTVEGKITTTASASGRRWSTGMQSAHDPIKPPTTKRPESGYGKQSSQPHQHTPPPPTVTGHEARTVREAFSGSTSSAASLKSRLPKSGGSWVGSFQGQARTVAGVSMADSRGEVSRAGLTVIQPTLSSLSPLSTLTGNTATNGGEEGEESFGERGYTPRQYRYEVNQREPTKALASKHKGKSQMR